MYQMDLMPCTPNLFGDNVLYYSLCFLDQHPWPHSFWMWWFPLMILSCRIKHITIDLTRFFNFFSSNFVARPQATCRSATKTCFSFPGSVGMRWSLPGFPPPRRLSTMPRVPLSLCVYVVGFLSTSAEATRREPRRLPRRLGRTPRAVHS